LVDDNEKTVSLPRVQSLLLWVIHEAAGELATLGQSDVWSEIP